MNRLRDHVQGAEAPEEREAVERAVALASEAVREAPRHRWSRAARRAGAGIGVAGVAAVLGLTPAGAEVRDLVDRAVGGSPEQQETRPPASPRPLRVPGGGLLLARSSGEMVVISNDREPQRLGAWEDASLSPNGINAAVTSGGQLTAVPIGADSEQTAPAWRIGKRGTRPVVSDPRWAPSGIRIAYRRGSELRIAIANGTGSGTLARGINPVAPAWRPQVSTLDPDVLAFSKPGRVVLIDGATGVRRGQIRDVRPIALGWVDSQRLVVVEPDRVAAYAIGTETTGPLSAAPGAAVRPPGRFEPLIEVSLTGEEAALISAHRERSSLLLVRFGKDELPEVRTLFSGPGKLAMPILSPDGRWLLNGWSQPKQWLFVRADLRGTGPKAIAVPEPSTRLGDDLDAKHRLPVALDWCCK